MSYTDNAEKGKLSTRDRFIIIGAILAVLLAGFVIVNGVLADRPYAVNKAPTNVVGTSEKMMEMKRQEQQKAAQAQVNQGGSGGGGIGDDIDPAKFRK